MNYFDAKKTLKDLPGIGDKIADCVLLFSLDHLEFIRVFFKVYFMNN